MGDGEYRKSALQSHSTHKNGFVSNVCNWKLAVVFQLHDWGAEEELCVCVCVGDTCIQINSSFAGIQMRTIFQRKLVFSRSCWHFEWLRNICGEYILCLPMVSDSKAHSTHTARWRYNSFNHNNNKKWTHTEHVKHLGTRARVCDGIVHIPTHSDAFPNPKTWMQHIHSIYASGPHRISACLRMFIYTGIRPFNNDYMSMPCYDLYIAHRTQYHFTTRLNCQLNSLSGTMLFQMA